MSFLDNAKHAAKDAATKAQQAAAEAAAKAQDFAADHKEQVAGAIDKSGDLVNKGTKGRFAKQVGSVTDKAGNVVDKLERKSE